MPENMHIMPTSLLSGSIKIDLYVKKIESRENRRGILCQFVTVFARWSMGANIEKLRKGNEIAYA